jgi:RNase P subunit RPR2
VLQLIQSARLTEPAASFNVSVSPTTCVVGSTVLFIPAAGPRCRIRLMGSEGRFTAICKDCGWQSRTFTEQWEMLIDGGRANDVVLLSSG